MVRLTTALRRNVRTQPSDRIRSAPLPDRSLVVAIDVLIDRLTAPALWKNGQAADALRFYRLLEFWRRQTFRARVAELSKDYEPFDPDHELTMRRRVGGEERRVLQKSYVEKVRSLLTSTGFVEIHADQIPKLSKSEIYGLDLALSLDVFDEMALFQRGAGTEIVNRRSARKLFLGSTTVEVPVFRRLCLVFKLKPRDIRIAEVMANKKCDRQRAELIVAEEWHRLPPNISSDAIYLKLLKDVPLTDLETVFPNTRVRFWALEKVKLGIVAAASVGIGIAGAVTRLQSAADLVGISIALLGVAAACAHQISSILARRNRYLLKMARTLYFHALAENEGVLSLLAERGAEAAVKHEMLLYSVLAKQPATVHDLDEIVAAVERHMASAYGLDVEFRIDDALARLIEDGIVERHADGRLETLPPAAAAAHIAALTGSYVEHLAEGSPPVPFVAPTGSGAPQT
jgi:uncharacterized protein DUF3754